MKEFLLKKVERIRLLAMLLTTLCAYATAAAQLSSDEISEAVLVEGSVPVKWTNDAEHPWYIPEGKSYIRTPETEEDYHFTSSISFTFTSSYPVIISFDWSRYNTYYGETLTVYVDGEEKSHTSNKYWSNIELKVKEGNHTIQFVSVSSINYAGVEYYAAIRNLRVWECKELEKACLAEGSLPITFENEEDLNKMWVTEDGYIRSTATPGADSTTKFSTTITVDTPSVFAWEWRNLKNYRYDCTCTVYVDGLYYVYKYANTWNTESIVLYPGTHTIEFRQWSQDGNSLDIAEIRNVRLDQTWYDVTLNNPGELGVRLLQALGDKNLQDAELVKINGSMNSDDWSIVKQLTGLKAMDLSNTTLTEIPNEAMRGMSGLSTVLLPSTLTRIGNLAFYKTNFYRIDIPASVEEIGWRVWDETPLQYANFASDSKLKKIGHMAFRYTRLLEFIMPDSVTEITRYGHEANNGNWHEDYYDNWDVVAECYSLNKVHLSEGLTIVPRGVVHGCSALEEVIIPSKVTTIERLTFTNTGIKSISIPETVTKIGYRAFAGTQLEKLDIPPHVNDFGSQFAMDCSNLKEVTLNSYCWSMNEYFRNCTALQKVVLPCATPPSIYSNPFYGVTKANIELLVPDFAVESYKADPYWYGFTNIKASEEASVNDYWAIKGNLTLDGSHVMQGAPEVEMMEGSTLNLDTDSPQTFGDFVYNTSESTPTMLLSRSNAVTANSVESRFYVAKADTWYFFSPVTDVNMADVTYPATDSWVIRYYDGARRASEDATSGNWVNVPADGILKAGQGYIIQARSTGWLNLPAASAAENGKMLGSNEVSFELADNACETEANAGWNFVANPYPTYYDIYYIDMQAPITVWTGSTYKAYSLNDGDRGDDTFVLRPMQPFFVQKSAADITAGMPLVGRQVSTAIDRSRAPRVLTVDENRLKLNLEIFCDDKETADDYTRVVLNEKASLSYETVRDASKFMSMDAEVAQLFTLGAEGHPMAINERPYEDGNVALGVLLPATDRTYRISARRADRKAWLYDAETGIESDLTESDYFFTASKSGVDNKRFSIRFASAVNAVEGVEAEAVKVAGNTGSISVTAPAGAAVAVYGTDGSVIANATAENGILEFSVAGGVYVVKVNGESFKTIVR